MFADMVGSTALSAKVDPELLGGVIRRYQDAVAGAVGRYGGFVAKFMGDGVLAYFGFPHAFEDAAERAVRAAIGILSEVGAIEMPDGTRVQARIGIATGLVVVGEIIGTGMALPVIAKHGSDEQRAKFIAHSSENEKVSASNGSQTQLISGC